MRAMCTCSFPCLQEMLCIDCTSRLFCTMQPQTTEGTEIPRFVPNWRVRIQHRNHRDRSMGLSSWGPQKGRLSVRVTYLSQNQLGWERPLRSSSLNNDPTPCQLEQHYTVLFPRSFLSSIRLSRECISLMVVSLPHPTSSTYQCWIFTCCYTVNPLLSQSPSATFRFHCHHHREPRGLIQL